MNHRIIGGYVRGGGALRCSKHRRTRRQRITNTSHTGGGGASVHNCGNFLGSSVSLATCGRELCCARRCCRRCARRGGRKPRGSREASKTTVTPTPTDWWVKMTATGTLTYITYFEFVRRLIAKYLITVLNIYFWIARSCYFGAFIRQIC